MHVKHLDLTHNICSLHAAHHYVSHYKVLSTPSNKMVPKYYFPFLEPIPTKSESAYFTVTAGGFQVSMWETLLWELMWDKNN